MANLIQDYKYTGKQIPMEEVKVLYLSCGTQIPAIRTDTYKIFTPGLLENINSIQSIAAVTESYGTHQRHKVDIYQSRKETGPLLVFWNGGGMTRGNRTISAVPKGLVYHNLGTFFASRGVTTLVPDYRRVNSKHGGEGATYPSGGEDVALLLKWLQTSSLTQNGRRDVYLLGNSAGALHVSTFLLDPSFSEERQAYAEGSRGYLHGAMESVSGRKGVLLAGVILLGMPGHFKGTSKDRREKVTAYYGSADKAEQHCPLGLLEALPRTNTNPPTGNIPKVLALVGEYDPPDEIVKPMADFVTKFQETLGHEGIEFKSLKGHNHISPLAALMSGDEAGEKWAEELVAHLLGGAKVDVDEGAKEILRGPHKKNHGGDAAAELKKSNGKEKGKEKEKETVEGERDGGH